jgi:hypothetical protein
MKKKTVVINLFAGAGAGKSTFAASIFSELKLRGLHAELVREFIKRWVWEGRTPVVGKFEQIYIFGQQAQEEGILYEKLDYLVTDSPLLLVPFYEEHLFGKKIVEPAVFNFIEHAKENGVEYINFWLPRPDHYEERGRNQTEEEAKELDSKLKEWLLNKGVALIELPIKHKDRVEKVLEILNLTHIPRFD